MTLKHTKINPKLSKEEAILYYLFVDEQLIIAWWDYLDCWNYLDNELKMKDSQDPEFTKKMKELMEYVEYWENIIDQLKNMITYEDIEYYVKQHPEIKKSYLFAR